VKKSRRFLIVMSSITAGALGGWWYFEEGSQIYDSRVSIKESSSFGKSADSSEENQVYFQKLIDPSAIRENTRVQTLFEVTSRAEARKAYALAQKTKSAAENQNRSNESLPLSIPGEERKDFPETTQIAQNTTEKIQAAEERETESLSSKQRTVSDELAVSLEALAQAVPGLDTKVASALTPNFKPRETVAKNGEKTNSNSSDSPRSSALIHIADFTSSPQDENTISSVALLTPGSNLSVKQRLKGLEQLENQEPPLEFQIVQREKIPHQEIGEMAQTSLPQLAGNFQNAEIREQIGNYASMPGNPFSSYGPAPTVQEPELQNPAAAEQSATEFVMEDSQKNETEANAVSAENTSEGEIPLELYRPKESTDSEDILNDSETPKEDDSERPESQKEMDTETSENQNDPPSSLIRIKKPVRKAEKQKEEPAEKYELDISRENIREALNIFQRETGLKVVSSLNVQGEVSCAAENTDPEILLGNLLADTQFEFIREEDFIYVTHSENIKSVTQPLSKTETRVFTPRYVSIDTLELVLSSNLTQFGSCRRIRKGGEESLEVTDWTLALNELEDVQNLIDLPEAQNSMNAFAFQHELNGAANQPLDLLSIAEGRGLVLQRMTIPELAQKTKKPLFSKKEEVPDIIAYSISHRADSFMIAVKDQLKVEPAWMPNPHSEALELNKPLVFEFGIKVNEVQVPYLISVTFRENPDAAQNGESPILAEVDCRPKGELNPKSEPKTIHFTMPMPSSSGNSLVFQLNMGEFALENKETRKNPIYAFHGNRTVKEVILILNPFKDMQELPETALTSNAVKAIIKQQEVMGRKFYGSLDKKERNYSEICFSVAQKLRAGMNIQR